SGVGDRGEVLARAVAFDFTHAIEEIFVEHQRLGSSAGFARDYEQRVRKIDLLFETLYRRRIGAVEHVQFGEALAMAKRTAKDFGAKTASAHAQQHHVSEAVVSHSLAESRKFVSMLDQLFDYCNPTQGVADYLLMGLIFLPKRWVFAPDSPNPLSALGFLDRLLHHVGVRTEACGLPFKHAACDRSFLRLDA